MPKKYLDKEGLTRVHTKIENELKDYGKSFSVVLNSQDYKITFQLKNGNVVLSEQVIDLPLESVVVGGTYDDNTESIILTLQNGNTISIPVSDLIQGLITSDDLQTALANYYTKTQADTLLGGKQNTIDSTHKLDSDLVDDTNQTNKFVSSAEKTTWNEKQDELTTSSVEDGTLVNFIGFDADGNVKKGTPSPISVDSEVTEGSNNPVSSNAVYVYVNGQGFLTSITSTMITNALGYTPYSDSNPSGYQANVLEGVQVNGTDLSISSKKVNLETKTAYNSSTNKIATESDLPTKSSLGLDNVVNVGMDNVPTQYSDNYVKSGGVYSAVNNAVEIAEGKTKNYVIDDTTTGTDIVNSSFNSIQNTVAITFTSTTKIVDVENNNVLLKDLKIGDIVSITQTDVPDRWVGSIVSDTITFYKLETKIDVASSVQSGNANPVSSGAVDNWGKYNYLNTGRSYSSTYTVGDLYSEHGENFILYYDRYIVRVATGYPSGTYVLYAMDLKGNSVIRSPSGIVSSTTLLSLLQNEAYAEPIDSQDLKARLHLGAFDTVDTSNANYDLITRKTGYLTSEDLMALSWAYQGDSDRWYANVSLGTSSSDIIPTRTNKTDDFTSAFVYGYSTLFLYTTTITTSSQFYPLLQKMEWQYQLPQNQWYEEKIIKNQPLNTLDQQGSQWVRNEWEKTLNLFNAISCLYKTNATLTTGTITFATSGNTGGDLKIRLELDETLYAYLLNQITTNGYKKVSFTKTSNFNRIKFYFSGNVQDGQVSYDVSNIPNGTLITLSFDFTYSYNNSVVANIMLNEGDHAYPYHDYGGTMIPCITDRKGRSRFIEGRMTLNDTYIPSASLDVSTVYCKWSLSGSHLLVVLKFKNTSALTFPASPIRKVIATANELPSWILDKIVNIYDDGYNIIASISTFYPFGMSGNFDAVIGKYNNKLEVSIVDNTAQTITANCGCIVAFDLLIDND